MNFKSIIKHLLLISTVALFAKCEKVIDATGPPFRQQVVLTGLLQPDSLISLEISFSAPANRPVDYQRVTNAAVSFYENGTEIGVITGALDGMYRLNRKPVSGGRYRVLVNVPSYGILTAEDTLPSLPSAKLMASNPNPANPNQNPDFSLNWNILQAGSGPSTYWLGTYVYQFRSVLGPGCPSNFAGGILPPGCDFVSRLQATYNPPLANSLYPDRFNAFHDSFYGKYLYSGLLRFAPENLIGKSVSFDFTLSNQIPDRNRRKTGEGLVIDFMALGPQYDRYLKSAVQSYQNRINSAEDALVNPFAEVTPIYTNVTNGLGIFGAMNRQRISY